MPFPIEVRFLGGLTPHQQEVFTKAAKRWVKIITSTFPAVRIGNDTIKGLLIEAKGKNIDGSGNVLGQSGPTHLRPHTLIPAKGTMEYDKADLKEMEDDGTLQSVITHEMGHVIGIGTIWESKELLKGAGTVNPVFTGSKAIHEFAKLLHPSHNAPIPVENTGGPGTRDGHWREKVFGDELMTGFLSGATQPLSRMTIASLDDIGYHVDMTKADAYELPTALHLAMLGIGAAEAKVRRCSHYSPGFKLPKPTVLPSSVVL